MDAEADELEAALRAHLGAYDGVLGATELDTRTRVAG
jgi:hypothetical protein